MALIEMRDVCKSYTRGSQTVEVLKGTNLDVEQGDFLALMGPSGSGKSTILNIMAGIDGVTSGSVTFNGARIDTLGENKLARWRANNVGFVFQFYHLLQALNAQRNVELPLLLKRMTGAERRRRAAVALELVQLSDRARHKPSELSGGQQQRVAIARAIVSDPLMLVCDEPTGDLDRETGDEIMSLLQLLNSKYDKTIVMVTHDPKSAQYANSVLHLDKGSFVGGSDAQER